jgi:5-keto 4-deoxyuronate isomerase
MTEDDQKLILPYMMTEPSGREFEVLRTVSAMGRSRWWIRHLACGQEFYAFKWSLAGSGKKCPGCGVVLGWDDLKPKVKA